MRKKKKKTIEPKCKNCMLYKKGEGLCGVAILIKGEKFNMPVDPEDHCHMDELNIPVEQVRWRVEDEQGNFTDKNGTVKIEYPDNFFGENPA